MFPEHIRRQNVAIVVQKMAQARRWSYGLNNFMTSIEERALDGVCTSKLRMVLDVHWEYKLSVTIRERRIGCWPLRLVDKSFMVPRGEIVEMQRTVAGCAITVRCLTSTQ